MPTVDQGASTISSSISLVKTIIGAGLLSMPLAFSTDGIVAGIFIILLAAVTSGYGLFLQAYTSKYVPTGHATFFNLCSVTYPTLSVVFDIAIAVQCFGCALSYLVLIGDITPTIITYVPYVDPEHHRTFWILVSTIICVPLSFLKNLDSLKYTSILGLVAIFYMSLLVIGHFLIGDVPSELKGDIVLIPPTVTGIFSTFSIIVFAFTGHQNMFSIVNEARDKSLTSLTGLVNLAILISAVLFIVVGLAGYLTFGDKVNGNVILSYPNAWTTSLGRFCIVFMVIFSFPLMIHPARISVNNIYYWTKINLFHQPESEEATAPPSESTGLLSATETHESLEIAATKAQSHIVPFPDNVFIIITAALLIAGYILAITIKSFALVLAIVGATGSTAISFILPGLFGWKLIGSESDDPSVLEVIFKNLSLGLTIWGFVVMVLCLYTSLFLNQV
ncbi:vacuolar amino acid transporter 7 [Scheffersomyces xylosifermentans]|uniref:vacuolar amino acid transporter 7 n=1 Tax=Scheffersomyces xylosifermentans TaxID=1304137 RepID=UPI00315C90AA